MSLYPFFLGSLPQPPFTEPTNPRNKDRWRKPDGRWVRYDGQQWKQEKR